MGTTASNIAALEQLFGNKQRASIQSVSLPYATALAEIQMLKAAQANVIATKIDSWLQARTLAQAQPGADVTPEVNAAKNLEQAFIDFTGTTPTSLPEVTNALTAWSEQYGILEVGTPDVPPPPAVPPNLLAYLGI